ncbi:MAG: hypothetical protein Q4G43_08915 [Mobilicoccus sp.]|nr:hypothetical protein [Mobilicoccus sp.]
MDPALAVQVLQWVAIIVLYCGLAACLRETRLLRAQVSRLQVGLAATGEALPDRHESLPARVVAGREGVVVVADTTCPSCASVLERLDDLRAALDLPVTVLTWEDPEAWGPLTDRFRIVRDEDAWSALAHLTPPILLRVAADGRILALHLPVTTSDVDATLTSWGALAGEPSERGHA